VHGNTLCQAIGTLKVLAAKSLSFTARVTASVSSLLTNRATAIPRNARTVRARARITVGPRPPSPAEPSRAVAVRTTITLVLTAAVNHPFRVMSTGIEEVTIHARDPAELL
jgi:hypothetical protein